MAPQMLFLMKKISNKDSGKLLLHLIDVCEDVEKQAA